MKLFSFLARLRALFTSANSSGDGKRSRPKRRPRLEMLESRLSPACNSISGYVFNDGNSNGLFDPGESILANVPIQLRNSAGAVVASTTTDANGFYNFSVDDTIDTSATTLTRNASIPTTGTDWTRPVTIGQFDAALGTLTAVEIVSSGAFVSLIRVENLDGMPAVIAAVGSGVLTLSGPSVNALVTNASTSKSFSASAFDGTIDFAGSSGNDFGSQVAQGTNSILLTSPADLAAYIGQGNISFTEVAHATAGASGAGNLLAQINTTASAQVSVIYHYIPSNCLKPGTYTIVEAQQPGGFLDGFESSAGAVLPGSVSTDAIVISLGNTNSAGNNFAEIRPGSLSGTVYLDINNNGLQDGAETGISQTTVTLTGTNDIGTVSLTTLTAADGSFAFHNLRPGNYTIAETQPGNFLDGKDSTGSLGGSAGNDRFSAVVLPAGGAGVHYDFGELPAASLSGFVYLDRNNNGLREYFESGIAGVTVTLTGVDDQGQAVSVQQSTGSDGSYRFGGLRPGTFAIAETQPSAYLSGKNSVGTAGGAIVQDEFVGINLGPNISGANYDFGEILSPGTTGMVFADVFTGGSAFGPPPAVYILSKAQFLSNYGLPGLDPVVQSKAIFVDSLYRSMLRRPVDDAGLIHWVHMLHTGVPRIAITHAIYASAEHRGLQVEMFYATFLHRTADAAGRAHWSAQLQAGMSEADVARQFLASEEYQSAHQDDAFFIRGLYADVLGRSAGIDEVVGWLQAMQGGAGRDAVAQAFLTSSESHARVLQSSYLNILHRAADNSGAAHWTALLNSGRISPQGLTEEFYSSQEFFDLALRSSQS